ncbi:MAG: FecR family protein [Fermentimonas sp.]|jgi:transmembrane sensor
MDRKTLHSFFEGKTDIAEEILIRDWIEDSNENYEVYLNERAIYDNELLNGYNEDKKHNNKRSLSYVVLSIAAVFVAIIFGGLYLLTNNNSFEDKFNTLVVPPGQRINIILSDNSDIWLNSNSKLTYPTSFGKDKRIVYLDGEAYFEISKDKDKPFIVKTSEGDIHVTGTKFNVEAFSKVKSFETSLFEGGVNISKNDKFIGALKPNETARFDGNKLVISKITDRDKYIWKDGLIGFNNKTLKEIFIVLENYFGVDIEVINEDLSKHTYTGKFRQSDGIGYALNVLSRNIKFKYIMNTETGVIEIR